MKNFNLVVCFMCLVICVIIDRMDGAGIIVGLLVVDYLRKISDALTKMNKPQ